MQLIKKTSKYFIPFFVLILTGCVTSQPYDYTALENSKPRSIVVIPPLNNSVEVGAPYVFLSTISKPLAEKGYYVFPVSVIDNFLKQNGLPTPAEMNTIPLNKIREHIGADSVLYVSIEEWGQSYQLISSVTVVKAHLRLVDTKTGELLWNSTAFAQKSSGDGGGGPLGALIGAIVEQIASSIVDHTPVLARQANSSAVFNNVNGLLNGPYAKPDAKL